MRKALYPGTFDPITFGHLDVVKRALRLFDEVVLAVAQNDSKTPWFTPQERLELIRENVKDLPNVSVRLLEGLTVEFAKNIGACALIRGLRAVSDFDFEFQMAQMNRHLNDEIETIFLMPSQKYFYTSSTLVKQVCSAKNAEHIAPFIPPNVIEAMRLKRRMDPQ